jgi:HEAT repeat protein
MTLLLRVLAPAVVLFVFVAELPADSDTNRIPQLIKALDDENVRYGASIALAQLGHEAVPALRQSLASDKPDRRVWAAYTLGEIGPAAKSAVNDLTKALGNTSDATLRAAAAQSLGRIGPAAASSVSILTERLSDENRQVRQRSAVALGTIGPAAGDAAPGLITALKDHQLRAAARTALIQIGKPTADALLESLADDSLRFDAAEILLQVDSEKARQNRVDNPTPADLTSLRLVLHDPTRSAPERTRAATALASLGMQGINVLIIAFEDQAIASTAAAAFASVGPDGVAPLIDALAHKQPGVRSAAVDALGCIGPEASESVPHLVSLFQDDDHDVRYRAIRALDRFGETVAPAVPDLVELMLDSKQREPARQWAIMTLINVHPVAHDVVVKGLIKASQDKGNYGVSSLARLQVRKIDRDAAEAAGVR